MARLYPSLERMDSIRGTAAAVRRAVNDAMHLCGTPANPIHDDGEAWASCFGPLVEAVVTLRKTLRVNGRWLTAERLRGWDGTIHTVFEGVPEPTKVVNPIPGLRAWVQDLERRLKSGSWPVVDLEESTYIGTALRMLDRGVAAWMKANPKHVLQQATRAAKAPADHRPPLTDKQSAALEILKQWKKHSPNKGLTGTVLMQRMRERGIRIDHSELTTHVMPDLMDFYGVENAPGRGYYLR